MTVVRDGNTANGVIWITLGNGTVPMDRTSAFVANPSHSNAANGEVGGSNSDYATAVTRRIVQTNDIAHDFLSVSLPTSAVNEYYSFQKEFRVTPT